MKRRNFLKTTSLCLVGPNINWGKILDSPSIDRELIYTNPLKADADVKNFELEGKAKISFPNGKMRMENALDPSLKQKANFVYWCEKDFPSDISIEWNFKPIREPGLAILFFSSLGLNGKSIFDTSQPKREGIYKQYHSGEINTYHISYFRRKHKAERAFHTCNLRKSKGFNLVAKGPDPMSSVVDIQTPYRMRVDKLNGRIKLFINELLIFDWHDNGKEYGPVLSGGKIGFRQMAPLVAEYSKLRIYKLEEK